MRSAFSKYTAELFAGLALLVATPLAAQEGSSEELSLTVFEAGTTISAEQMNANFEALKTALEAVQIENASLKTDLEAVQAENASLKTDLQAAQTEISNLKTGLDTVETEHDDLDARVVPLEVFNADLQTYVSVNPDYWGYPAIIINDANLHVQNGLADTETVNGTGNVIIGYNELRVDTFDEAVCSLGQHTNQTDCESAGGVWTTTHKSGSHNLVIGRGHNYSSFGGLVAGSHNTINGPEASVTGGLGNIASGDRAGVSGGSFNVASGDSATVNGGSLNTASADGAVVTGGQGNTASARVATVSGGENNIANGPVASVTGGEANTAEGSAASVNGGWNNTASGEFSTVGGGNGCEVSATDGWDAGC